MNHRNFSTKDAELKIGHLKAIQRNQEYLRLSSCKHLRFRLVGRQVCVGHVLDPPGARAKQSTETPFFQSHGLIVYMYISRGNIMMTIFCKRSTARLYIQKNADLVYT